MSTTNSEISTLDYSQKQGRKMKLRLQCKNNKYPLFYFRIILWALFLISKAMKENSKVMKLNSKKKNLLPTNLLSRSLFSVVKFKD